MTALAFVDTNLLIYSRDSTDTSRHAMARAWLDLLWRDRTGRISAQVLSEYFYVATRKSRPAIDPEGAWGDVQDLIWPPGVNGHAWVSHARARAQ
jgi:predicted nucleic acid-binding protein